MSVNLSCPIFNRAESINASIDALVNKRFAINLFLVWFLD